MYSLPTFLLLLLLQPLDGFLVTSPQHRTSSTLASSIASQEPLAQHGDWQAFFDEERYCLMYYFNTKTGDSQWEPPADFPIPKLDSHSNVLEETTPKQNKKKVIVKPNKSAEQPEPAAVLFKAVLGFAVTVAEKATEAIVDHVAKQQEQQPAKQEQQQPWWSNLFQPKQQTTAKEKTTSNTEIVDLLSEINGSIHRTSAVPSEHLSRKHTSTNTAKKQAAFWANWKSDEPTRPLVPPSHREQWIQEKLYADSLKRQENLRKNYRKVIENRSPTISLSALKRDNNKDWLQFLND